MGYPVYYSGEIVVTPPLTREHADLLLTVSRMERTEETEAIFAAIAASPDPDLPSYGHLLEVAKEGALLVPSDWEGRHGMRRWLALLIEYLLAPQGYVLNGSFVWTGDNPEDRGCIFVQNNLIEAVEDRIVNDGPSWSPSHFVDERLRIILLELVTSASDSVNSIGFAVTASSLAALQEAMKRL